jgi:predicted phage terminase large subunit-like protein
MLDFSLLSRAKPLIAEHLKKDLAAFVRAAWPMMHPGTRLSWSIGHDLICEWLTLVWEGQARRLIINCPPRFSKSTILNCFAVWVWLQDPSKSFLAASYEIDLALNGNADRRRLIESKWFQSFFPDAFSLQTDRMQAGDFQNSHGGRMQAASTNSKAQGRGGDFILIDDPNSADSIYSASYRNETNLWLTNQLPQRLNDPSKSAIVLVQQRLHQSDCTGFLVDQEDSGWKLLALPLIAEEDTIIIFPRSGRIWKRPKGSCLDPKRWNPRAVRERQRNRLVWAGQFQQSPMAAEGNIIHTDDILYFGGRDPQTGAMDPGLPESFERKIISVDASFKDLRTSDYVAVIVVGVVGSRRYVLHVTNAHLDLTGTENEIRNCRAAYGPISAVLIEDKANGPSVVNHLKDEISGVVAIDPEGGKIARLVAASPEFQAHNWIIERNGPWTHRVVEQLTMFPNCKNDDIADAVSQASIWLQANTYEFGLLDYFKSVVTGKRNFPVSVEEHVAGAVKAEQPVTVTRDQIKEWSENQRAPACPHPECGNTSTALMPDAHGKMHVFCRQCGRTDGQEKPREPGKCCGDFLPQHVSGQIRCGNCGAQTQPNTVLAGMSRAAYLKRITRLRGF